MSPTQIARLLLATAVTGAIAAAPAHAVSGLADASVGAIAAQYPPPQTAPSIRETPAAQQAPTPNVEQSRTDATPLPEPAGLPIAQAPEDEARELPASEPIPALAGDDDAVDDDGLPVTGWQALAVALMGAALLSAGLVLRRTVGRRRA